MEILLSEIKPYPKNAKKHPLNQIKQIADSIKEFGFNQPLVVDKNNVIIVGHGRYEAAKLLNLDKVPVLQVDLDEKRAKAYRLADNKLNESDWDMEQVISELKSLEDDVLVALSGFEKDLLIEYNEQDDVIPENAPTRAKLGDLWQLGRHRLLCGDSTKKEDVERLMDGKKADMVFTDPPYGILYLPETEKLSKLGYLKSDTKNFQNFADTIHKFIPILIEFLKGGGSFYIFMGWEQMGTLIDALKRADCHIYCHLVWDRYLPTLRKFPQDYIPSHENFLYGWKSGANRIRQNGGSFHKTIWTINRLNSKEMQHITQKPVELAQNAILNSAKQEDIVLDLFLGSGSTLIAAEKTGRICYAMEIDEKYCDIIIKRWEDYTSLTAQKL